MFSCGWRLGVAAVQLAVADDAFALGADVDEDLVLVDADDRALDDVAVLEALDVRVLLGEQLLHRRRLGPIVARRRRTGSSSSLAAAGAASSSSALTRPRPSAGRRQAPSDAGGVGGLVGVGGRGSSAVAGLGGLRGDGLGRGALDRLGGFGLDGRRAASRSLSGSIVGSGARAVGAGRSAASSVLVAGSSATATAATCLGAWSAAGRSASGSGAVPPCCSSVKVIWSLLVVDSRPRITTASSDAQAVSERSGGPW